MKLISRFLPEISRPEKSGLVTVDASDFMAREFPPRENILDPWLQTQALTMIHAPRGIGKTLLSLGIAHAVGTGSSFLRWKAPKARGVLFVDGEMPGIALQERLKTIIDHTGESPGSLLRIITPDLQHELIPDLASPAGQTAICEQISEETELIIFDNLSTLVRSGKENESESWQPIQSLALKLRAAGKAILFIHHSGKNGGQRGTSRREDVLDTVIGLRRPAEYNPSQGAMFEVHFEKARALYGENVSPFIAQYTPQNAASPWMITSLEDSTLERIIELSSEGLKQYEIAEELGVSKATVSRNLRQAREQGLILEKSNLNS